MILPFTVEQFVNVFSDYNKAVWPVQLLAIFLGLFCAYAVVRRSLTYDRIAAVCLAAMWVWTGLVYHALHFASINGAAYVFGAFFVLQGVWFAVEGFRGRLAFGSNGGLTSAVGWAFVAYAVILYPLVCLLTGHPYPQLPMFGVTPCPLMIFTLGLLLLTRNQPPFGLLAIPVLWSLIGGSAAFLLGVASDWPLLFSGVTATVLLYKRGKQ